MKTFLFLTIFSLALAVNAQQLEKLWVSAPDLQTPESALYNAVLDIVFVSNLGQVRDSKTGDGFIAQMNLKGEITTLKWLTGLNDPKGMAIFNGKLYVADMDELVEIDIKQAKVVKSYPAPNAKYLNDVTVCNNGMVFVSDMRDQRIYVLKNGVFESWLQHSDLENVNGLWAEKGKLFAGNASVWEIDIKTKAMNELYVKTQGIDGLEKLENGEFIFSNWAGRIHITKQQKVVTLLNRAENQQNTADIDFVPHKNLVLVPTFFGNTVEAFTLAY